MRGRPLSACLALAAGLLLLAAGVRAEPLKINFLPQWVPQAQFAGYYMALDKGFYAENGLDVRILRGGPDSPPTHLLADGRVDIATMFLSTAVIRRAQGIPLVNICQLVGHSSLMLVAKKKNGIESITDLEGRKVSVWEAEFEAQPRALFALEGVSVTIIPQTSTVNLFLLDGVAAASAMWYNEYHTIIDSGLDPDELTTIFFRDTPFDFPEDGIYTTSAFYDKHPEACDAFARASLAGWRYAFEHVDEALEAVTRRMEEAGVPCSLAHQRWMLMRFRDLVMPEQGPLTGALPFGEYMRVAESLESVGLIYSIPAYEEFYRGPGR